MINQISTVLFLVFAVGVSVAIAKHDKYESQAQTKHYPSENQWRNSKSSAQTSYYNTLEKEGNGTQVQETASTNDAIRRLKYSTTGYGTLGTYPNTATGLSSFGPIKLDIGGIVVGTLVGLGAVIIIPKLISALHGGYGSYARSESDDLLSVTGMINRLDDVLAQNNIDSTSCMQRAVCNYVRSTESNLRLGSQDQIDQFVHSLSENSLVDYLLDGTAIKEALAQGKNMKGNSCDTVYSTCPLDSKAAMGLLTQMLPVKH